MEVHKCQWGKKDRKLGKLREGYKNWSAKRKLEFVDDTQENEPLRKRVTRSTEVGKSTFLTKYYCILTIGG